MATPLSKPVRRTVARDNLTVIMAPEGVFVRDRGRRTLYGPLSYGALRLRCAMVNAAVIERARAERRQARRAMRGC